MTLVAVIEAAKGTRFRAARRLALAGVLACVWTASARAEPSPSDRAIAVTLFREGKDLAARGSNAEACAKFMQSHRLDPKIGSLLHVATCHELEGRTTSAWLAYTEAVALAARAKQEDREKLAREKVRILEPLLPKVVVVAPSLASGEEVKLDGTLVGEGTLGTPVPVDPGEHQVTAQAPSKKPWSRTLHVARGPSSVTIDVPPLVSEETPSSPSSLPASVTEEPSSEGAPSAAPRTVGWVLVATSVAAVGVGTGFGLRAAAQAKDANAVCPERSCPTSEGVQMHEDAKTSALISTVAFGVGAAAAGAGLYLLLTSKSAPSSSKGIGLRLLPRLEPKVGGLDASIRF